jgi:hypothetical protein
MLGASQLTFPVSLLLTQNGLISGMSSSTSQWLTPYFSGQNVAAWTLLNAEEMGNMVHCVLGNRNRLTHYNVSVKPTSREIFFFT